METFEQHQQVYRQQHSTLGCKITHMFGVPMIAASIPVLLFRWQLGVLLFVAGWTLQFIGHYVFEKNKPVFFGNPTNPFTYCSALVFVTAEWMKFLRGKPLVEPAGTHTHS